MSTQTPSWAGSSVGRVVHGSATCCTRRQRNILVLTIAMMVLVTVFSSSTHRNMALEYMKPATLIISEKFTDTKTKTVTMMIEPSTSVRVVTSTSVVLVPTAINPGSTLASTPAEIQAADQPPPKGERFAFATFLNRPYTPLETDDEDGYYVMARMMAYQLLHDPVTRTRKNYPFLVLASEGVEESKLARLQADGATIIRVKRLTAEWLKTKNSQWWDQLTKLRLFELTQYDKIAYFDTDTIIRKNIDGIFEDPATAIAINRGKADETPDDEGDQPQRYMFAGNAGAGSFKHTIPPPTGRQNLNCGCFVIWPSKDVFNYYVRVMQIEDRFPKKYQEQALLSYVHRWAGNMPWVQLDWRWNINYATFNDTLADIHSLHVKFWQADHDQSLNNLLQDMKGRMYGYWIGREHVSVQN